MLTARPPFTGRMNLHAAMAGLLVLDENAIHHFNTCDESITVATLAPYSVVAAGDMVATIKIIPFSIPQDLMEKVGPVGTFCGVRGGVQVPSGLLLFPLCCRI